MFGQFAQRSYAFSLFCILLSAFISSKPVWSQFQIVGYYPSWLRWTLSANQIPFDYLTHINHAFAWPKMDGTIGFDYNLNDPQLIEETHMAGKKILLSVGGWGHSAAFPTVVADTSLRRKFLDHLVEFIQMRGYDGVDLDWEFPQNQADRKNLTELFAALRARCNAAEPPLLLTTAISSGSYYGQWYEYEKLVEYVDWFNVMTYDYHGSWTNHAGHNAPLIAPSQCSHGDITKSIAYLTQTRKLPKEKLRLGIPFYGRQFYATGLYAPSTGGDATYNYSEIQPLLAGGGWNYFWDNYSQVPYLINTLGTKFITFDDTASVRKKIQFAYESGLGGVMIWALGQDWVNQKAVLLEAIDREVQVLTRVAHEESIPSSCSLKSYPNPVRSMAILEISLPESVEARLSIYNSLGQLVDERWKIKNVGTIQLQWTPNNLPNGVYFIRLVTPKTVVTQKMLVLR